MSPTQPVSAADLSELTEDIRRQERRRDSEQVIKARKMIPSETNSQNNDKYEEEFEGDLAKAA